MRRKRLPNKDEVWERVRAFAIERAESGVPVPTLQEGVVNKIIAVEGARIERESAQGRTNKTPIYRGELLRVWKDLAKNKHTRKARPNYFTLALLQVALSDLIDDLGDGTIALRGHRPAPAKPPRLVSYAESVSEGRTGRRRSSTAAEARELRESDAHWRIKHYIDQWPALALAGMPGGPWVRAGLEVPLRVPTADRVDVIVRGQSDGRRLLIEVKPSVPSGKAGLGLYAQAAKYGAIWRVLHGLGETGVRVALATPKLRKGLADRMRERHGIESVAVKVPRDFEAPRRDD